MEDKFTKIYEKMLLEEAQKASELQTLEEVAKKYKHQRLGHKGLKLSKRLATVKAKYKSSKEIERLSELSAKREVQKRLSNQLFNKNYGDLNDSEKDKIKKRMHSPAAENSVEKITKQKASERKEKQQKKQKEAAEKTQRESSSRKEKTERETQEHKEEKIKAERKEERETQKKKESQESPKKIPQRTKILPKTKIIL